MGMAPLTVTFLNFRDLIYFSASGTKTREMEMTRFPPGGMTVSSLKYSVEEDFPRMNQFITPAVASAGNSSTSPSFLRSVTARKAWGGSLEKNM